MLLCEHFVSNSFFMWLICERNYFNKGIIFFCNIELSKSPSCIFSHQHFLRRIFHTVLTAAFPLSKQIASILAHTAINLIAARGVLEKAEKSSSSFIASWLLVPKLAHLMWTFDHSSAAAKDRAIHKKKSSNESQPWCYMQTPLTLCYFLFFRVERKEKISRLDSGIISEAHLHISSTSFH